MDIVLLNSHRMATDGQKRALLSFSIRLIDPLSFAIAIDSLRRNENPLLTRSLLNSDAVDCSAKVGVLDIEERFAVSIVLSNSLVFNPIHFAYCEPFNRINNLHVNDFTKLCSYLQKSIKNASFHADPHTIPMNE